MIKHNQDGAVSGLAISLVMAILLLIGAAGFGYWAYSGRQDYKNNVDAKISDAVKAAVAKEDKIKDAQFAEDYKKPLKTYKGPEAYGSLRISFPKTWSAYVDASGKASGNSLLDGYLAPGAVPSIEEKNSIFAVRVQVIDKTYSETLKSFTTQQRDGKLKVSAYALPKLPKTVGVKAVGLINSNDTTSATMIVLPLRSQTLEIWTQGNQYLKDFNNIILPNFSFSP